MLRYIQIFFFCFCILASENLLANLLKDRIQRANAGDYVVVEQNKITSVLSVHSKTKNTLTLEEVSIPSSMASKVTNWKGWVNQSAPGHSSWVMYEIDLPSNRIIECFSFSKSAWLKLSQQDYWLTYLFQVPLRFVPKQERKKIGPEPMRGEKDYRKIWHPHITFESKPQKIPSKAYKGVWPSDGTELANKRFELYFDESHLSPFPSWIQVGNAHITLNVRVIESGRQLKSPYKTLPKRAPEFWQNTKATETGYRLYISSPIYFKKHHLYVRDLSDPQKRLTLVAHREVRDDESVILDINYSALKGLLTPSHQYSWVITPVEAHSIHAESLDSFAWQAENLQDLAK